MDNFKFKIACEQLLLGTVSYEMLDYLCGHYLTKPKYYWGTKRLTSTSGRAKRHHKIMLTALQNYTSWTISMKEFKVATMAANYG